MTAGVVGKYTGVKRNELPDVRSLEIARLRRVARWCLVTGCIGDDQLDFCGVVVGQIVQLGGAGHVAPGAVAVQTDRPRHLHTCNAQRQGAPWLVRSTQGRSAHPRDGTAMGHRGVDVHA